MGNDNLSAHPANEYDRHVRRVIPYYDCLQAETIDLVRARFDAVPRWVDTGAGTGALVERAYAAFPETKFQLVDPSEAMLAEAGRRLAGKARAEVLRAGGSDQLPDRVPAGSATVVTALLCHHYLDMEGRAAALRGCRDVLAPGGLLVVFENVDAGSDEGRRLMLERWRRYQLGQGRSPAEVASHLARFGVELKPIPVARHLELLREVGFGSVELFWQSHLQAGFFAVRGD